PRFLYRIDPAPAPEATTWPLDGWSLAGRLAELLWSSVPDDALLDCAAAGQLVRGGPAPCGLDAQVARMLDDPRADALVVDFAAQWLQLRRLDERHDLADPPELRASMRGEVAHLVADALRRDVPVLDL